MLDKSYSVSPLAARLVSAVVVGTLWFSGDAPAGLASDGSSLASVATAFSALNAVAVAVPLGLTAWCADDERFRKLDEWLGTRHLSLPCGRNPWARPFTTLIGIANRHSVLIYCISLAEDIGAVYLMNLETHEAATLLATFILFPVAEFLAKQLANACIGSPIVNAAVAILSEAGQACLFAFFADFDGGAVGFFGCMLLLQLINVGLEFRLDSRNPPPVIGADGRWGFLIKSTLHEGLGFLLISLAFVLMQSVWVWLKASVALWVSVALAVLFWAVSSRLVFKGKQGDEKEMGLLGFILTILGGAFGPLIGGLVMLIATEWFVTGDWAQLVALCAGSAALAVVVHAAYVTAVASLLAMTGLGVDRFQGYGSQLFDVMGHRLEVVLTCLWEQVVFNTAVVAPGCIAASALLLVQTPCAIGWSWPLLWLWPLAVLAPQCVFFAVFGELAREWYAAE